jgi:hypothetical protein
MIYDECFTHLSCTTILRKKIVVQQLKIPLSIQRFKVQFFFQLSLKKLLLKKRNFIKFRQLPLGRRACNFHCCLGNMNPKHVSLKQMGPSSLSKHAKFIRNHYA